MTAAEWVANPHALAMIDALEGGPHDRPLRRFACACCRRMWGLLPRESREALEVARRYAGGEASDLELQTAREEAVRGYRRVDRQISYKKYKVRTQARAALAVVAATSPDGWQAAREAVMTLIDLFDQQPADLLREFVSEPFGSEVPVGGSGLA